MSYRNVFSMLGKILILSSAFYLFPVIACLCLGEYREILSFAVGAGVSLVVGVIFYVFKPKTKGIGTKEGLIIVGLSWVLISVIGALPLFVGGHLSSFIDCIFEMVSGFTTTGASVLTDFNIPKSMHFWRAFSHWLGGMGILVFILAVLPLQNAGSFQLMKFESPGPQVGKLVSKVKVTAAILYVIYFVLTIIEFLFLKIGGMDAFNAVMLSLSTAGTGGFAATAESIRGFNSVYVEVVITVFMLIFSINFNIYYLIIIKRFMVAIKDEELRFYLIFLFVATLLITTVNTISYEPYDNFFTSLRYSVFAVVSMASTTGFMSADFALWPLFSQLILLVVMFMGAMAGSTGGGFKASRGLILLKSAHSDTMHILRPRGIHSVKLNKKILSEGTIKGVRNHFFMAIMIIFIAALLVSLDAKADFTTAITSSLTCFSNVGPGLGSLVGPCGSFAALNGFSKISLSIVMLLGRLEIFPILLLFSPRAWSKRY